jgi:hypothetical protein
MGRREARLPMLVYCTKSPGLGKKYGTGIGGPVQITLHYAEESVTEPSACSNFAPCWKE